VSTWTAVCVDVIEKVARLAEDGSAAASEWHTGVQAARESAAAPGGVQLAQRLEDGILNTAYTLELLDGVGRDQLERLKRDRNLCAHPALLPLGGFYQPSAELARTHLVHAIDGLLEHPPIQGRKALDRFRAFLEDPSFTANPDFIAMTYFGSSRGATRRGIVTIAVKHALLELEGSGSLNSEILADRAGVCVGAFAARDRGFVSDLMRTSAAAFGIFRRVRR
jgi:hypothetical protein